MNSAKTQAWVSLFCPVIAWGSQIVFTLTLRNVHGLALFWLFAAVAQLALIVAGTYFSIRVLLLGRSSVPSSTANAALAGFTLSAGTILLVIVMMVLH